MADYIRNFIFGVEDSLVSTVGLLSGIAVAGMSRSEILLTGLVLIFVEAFSMGAGSYLSDYSAEEYLDGQKASPRRPIIGGIIMFFSYLTAGFVPLSPYLFLNTDSAFGLSIACSVLALFVLGAVSGKFFGGRTWRSAVRMFVVGGLATGVGVLVGTLVG